MLYWFAWQLYVACHFVTDPFFPSIFIIIFFSQLNLSFFSFLTAATFFSCIVCWSHPLLLSSSHPHVSPYIFPLFTNPFSLIPLQLHLIQPSFWASSLHLSLHFYFYLSLHFLFFNLTCQSVSTKLCSDENIKPTLFTTSTLIFKKKKQAICKQFTLSSIISCKKQNLPHLCNWVIDVHGRDC